MIKHLYIHIPFCKQKCKYCDFNSYANKDSFVEEYIKALKTEIQGYNLSKLETVYFGGGTPSYINEKYIEDIMSMLSLEENAEITLELNPGTITKEKLETYKKAGINRLSIGLQVTQNEILKEIGRIHTLKEFGETYDLARKIGYKNISVDIMFGLPNQTVEKLNESLNYLIGKKPEHISCYSLILHKQIFNNLPDEETERKMYYLIKEKLKKSGYIHYEISNFSKLGYESRHNLCYWNQEEYIGVGAGASSYDNKERYTNENNIEKYIEKISKKENIKNIEEIQNEEQKLNEYMILKLRLIEGVEIEKANKKFEIDIKEKYKKQIEKLKKLNLIEETKTHIKLSTKGLDLANQVWMEFI